MTYIVYCGLELFMPCFKPNSTYHSMYYIYSDWSKWFASFPWCQCRIFSV